MAVDPTSVGKASRFAVYVPAGESRLNLGKPDAKKLFGFPGVSLTTQQNVFIDARNIAHVQSIGAMRPQTKGGWDQFVGGDVYLAGKGNLTIATKSKVILSAGFGKGFDKLTKYNPNEPDWTAFNNLLLHYKFDAISVRM
jgi:hypothetical protein